MTDTRAALQAEGKHPAPCASHCEATAFKIEIRGLKARIAELEKDAAREPVAWRYTHGDFRHVSGAIIPGRTFLTDKKIECSEYFGGGCSDFNETPLYE